MIPGSANPLLLKPAEAAAAEGISRSLRFSSSDSAYASRVAVTPTDATKFTLSFWVKRSKLGAEQAIMYAGVDAANKYDRIAFNSNDTIELRQRRSSVDYTTTTSAVFRDCSAWYHVVYSWSSGTRTLYVNGVSQTFASNSTTTSTHYWQTSGVTQYLGRDNNEPASPYAYGDFMLADIHFIDSQALTPSAFGEFDTNGVWQPIAYAGSYGTNGFHLPFSDNSTAAALGTDTSSNGNDWTPNNLTVTGSSNYADYISRFTSGESKYNAFDGSLSTYVSQDVSDGTGITFAPSPSITVATQLRFYHTTGAPSTKEYIINGGSPVTTPNSGWVTTSFTGTLTSFVLRDNRGVGYSAALYAIEVDGTILVDVASGNDSLVDSPTNYGTDTGAGGEVRGNYATLNPLDKGSTVTLVNGNLDVSVTSPHNIAAGTVMVSSGKYYAEFVYSALEGGTSGLVGVCNPLASRTSYLGGTTGGVGYNPAGNKWVDGANTSGLTTSAVGDVIGIALDKDSNQVSFYKNNTLIFTQTGLNSAQPYTFAMGHNNSAGSFNFGQRPFAYTAPSGFKALCTANLPDPTIADGSTAMDVVTYTGNGSTQTISGLNFSPDFIWLKDRGQARSHRLIDTVRGIQYQLFSDTTDGGSAYDATSYVSSVTATSSTGFTVDGTGSDAYNELNKSYVAWTWDAGSSTVSNTDGSITSQVRANPSAGFSIVSYTGTGANGTVGHGLGVPLGFLIVKNRTSSGSSWVCWHSTFAGTERIDLEATGAKYTDAATWNSTVPSSTVFSVGTAGLNFSGNAIIAYCFAPVDGYSSFGSYTGNGSSDGPFVYTGHKSRWLMIKKSSNTGSWIIWDSARDTYNYFQYKLGANLSSPENDAATIGYTYQETLDSCSNGFKLRSTNQFTNTNGETYIFASFAENPFQYARAR